MAIAEPQRLLDHARAGAPAHLPGPEPNAGILAPLASTKIMAASRGETVMPGLVPGIHALNRESH